MKLNEKLISIVKRATIPCAWRVGLPLLSTIGKRKMRAARDYWLAVISDLWSEIRHAVPGILWVTIACQIWPWSLMGRRYGTPNLANFVGQDRPTDRKTAIRQHRKSVVVSLLIGRNHFSAPVNIRSPRSDTINYFGFAVSDRRSVANTVL